MTPMWNVIVAIEIGAAFLVEKKLFPAPKNGDRPRVGEFHVRAELLLALRQ